MSLVPPVASRPIIAVTTGVAVADGIARSRLNEAYTAALVAAGALPVILPILDPDLAADALAMARGLVLTGGEDVDPARYGAPRHPKAEPADVRRDAWEIALIEQARAREMPTLAICRGMQILNVALGGTLIQDIPEERPAAGLHALAAQRIERVHDVGIAPDGRLAEVIGASAIRVNSLHHQAPDRVADSLRVAATAGDGIIEAIETTGSWWVLAVQWHPEELLEGRDPWDRALFEAFVRRAASAPAISWRASSEPRRAPGA